jgi:hypothetical protein
MRNDGEGQAKAVIARSESTCLHAGVAISRDCFTSFAMALYTCKLIRGVHYEMRENR